MTSVTDSRVRKLPVVEGSGVGNNYDVIVVGGRPQRLARENGARLYDDAPVAGFD
jgi:hypothetical protein